MKMGMLWLKRLPIFKVTMRNIMRFVLTFRGNVYGCPMLSSLLGLRKADWGFGSLDAG
jgi:hypothetical protein